MDIYLNTMWGHSKFHTYVYMCWHTNSAFFLLEDWDYSPHTYMPAQTNCRKKTCIWELISSLAMLALMWKYKWQLKRTDAQDLYCCSCRCSSGSAAVNNIADCVNLLHWVSDQSMRTLWTFWCTFFFNNRHMQTCKTLAYPYISPRDVGTDGVQVVVVVSCFHEQSVTLG